MRIRFKHRMQKRIRHTKLKDQQPCLSDTKKEQVIELCTCHEATHPHTHKQETHDPHTCHLPHHVTRELNQATYHAPCVTLLSLHCNYSRSCILFIIFCLLMFAECRGGKEDADSCKTYAAGEITVPSTCAMLFSCSSTHLHTCFFLSLLLLLPSSPFHPSVTRSLMPSSSSSFLCFSLRLLLPVTINYGERQYYKFYTTEHKGFEELKPQENSQDNSQQENEGGEKHEGMLLKKKSTAAGETNNKSKR